MQASVDCLRKELPKTGGDMVKKCIEMSCVTWVSACLSWWNYVDSLCATMIDESYPVNTFDLIANVSELMSDGAVGALLDVISYIKVFLFGSTSVRIDLVDGCCGATSSFSATPTTPLTSSGNRSVLNVMLQGTALHVCHALLLDGVLKILITLKFWKHRSDAFIGVSLGTFVTKIITHLTAFKGLLDHSQRKEESFLYSNCVSNFVKRCYRLQNGDNDGAVISFLKTFWNEWKPLKGDRIDQVMVNLPGFLGGASGLFDLVEDQLVSVGASEKEKLLSIDLESREKKTDFTPRTSPIKPVTSSLGKMTARSFAPVSSAVLLSKSVQPAAMSSPYSPVINIRLTHPEATSAEISSVLGKRRQEVISSRSAIKVDPVIHSIDMGSAHVTKDGKQKARQWDVFPTYSSKDRVMMTAQSQQGSDSYVEMTDIHEYDEVYDTQKLCEVGTRLDVCDLDSGVTGQGEVYARSAIRGSSSQEDGTELDVTMNGEQNDAVGQADIPIDVHTLLDTSLTEASLRYSQAHSRQHGSIRVPLESDDTLTGATMIASANTSNDHVRVSLFPTHDGGPRSVDDEVIQHRGHEVFDLENGDDSVSSGLVSVLTYLQHADDVMQSLLCVSCEEGEDHAATEYSSQMKLEYMRTADDAALCCNELMARILQYRSLMTKSHVRNKFIDEKL